MNNILFWFTSVQFLYCMNLNNSTKCNIASFNPVPLCLAANVRQESRNMAASTYSSMRPLMTARVTYASLSLQNTRDVLWEIALINDAMKKTEEMSRIVTKPTK